MAANIGHSSTPLNQRAIADFADFNVFQLMRLLLRKDKGRNGATGQRLRFRAELDARFQGREITRLSRETRRLQHNDAERIVLHTPNYCVASEIGPLPAPFLEWVREQQRSGDEAMAAFFNLFNQRIHVLRYELKQRSLRALDTAPPEDTRYATQLAALLGLAQGDAQAQIPLPKRAWLGLAPLLVNHRRSPAVIAIVMSRYLGVKSRLRPLIGKWRAIEQPERIALGRRNHQLGRNSLLGRQMWDSQAGVRLEIARMAFGDMLPLLPVPSHSTSETPLGVRHGELAGLIHLLLDRRYDCEVEVAIDTASIPLARLVSNGLGLRLGQTAWLISSPSAVDEKPDSQLRFRIPAYEQDAPAKQRMAA